MNIPLKVGATLTSLPCKICASKAPLVGNVDFNKACQGLNEQGVDVGWGEAFGPSGILVPYYRCSGCLFLFTDFFDHWSDQDWKTHIYNDQYLRVDPESDLQGRPINSANLIEMIFQSHKTSLSILDYGGGEGHLETLLTQRGYQALSYDKFIGSSSYPEGKFDLIIAIEVIEHICDPQAFIQELDQLLEPNGVVFIRTSCIDTPHAQEALYHPYVAPRNGHVSIHSNASLKLLATNYRMQKSGLDIVDALGTIARVEGHFLVKGEPLWFRPRFT